MQSAPDRLARIKDGWLQLAFLMLRKEQRDLALLATIDLGPQDYFDRLVQLIKKREKRGYAIVYEDLQSVFGSNHAEEGSEPIEQLKQTAISSLQQHGIAYLADAVRPEDYWKNVPAPGMEKGNDDFDAAQGKLAQTLRDIISNSEATAQAVQTFPAPRELYELCPAVAAAQLSARVAAAILEQAAQYHVFAFVGLYRAPAVIDAITAAGYQIVQELWFDVMVVKTEKRAD
jgi:hypothetical protein